MSGRLHSLRVARVVDETHDARSLVFDVPSALRDAFRYEAGQFLTLEVVVEGARLRRCYSLASSPACDAEHKVTVKRVRGGRVSNWIHDHLRAGDAVDVMPPEGRFVLAPGDAPLLLFAGGSGVTPVLSILKTALATTKRTARLVYANRDARSIIFARDLDELARRHAGRLEIVHRLDDVHGMLDAGFVRSLVTRRDVDAYLCGPQPFMDTIERGLVDGGVDRARIRIERFVAANDAPKAPVNVAPSACTSIGVTLRGKRAEVPYDGKKTILRAAIDAGLDAPYSCEEGFCGCCVAQLTEGEVTMDADDALTDEDKRRRLILTCQARPRTARCAVEYPEGI